MRGTGSSMGIFYDTILFYCALGLITKTNIKRYKSNDSNTIENEAKSLISSEPTGI